jgi:hypothetical protein
MSKESCFFGPGRSAASRFFSAEALADEAMRACFFGSVPATAITLSDTPGPWSLLWKEVIGRSSKQDPGRKR